MSGASWYTESEGQSKKDLGARGGGKRYIVSHLWRRLLVSPFTSPRISRILYLSLVVMLAQHPVDSFLNSLHGSTMSSAQQLLVGTAVPHGVAPQSEVASKHSTLPPLRAIIFDKDGTLISFDATWCAWADSFIDRVGTRCGGDAARQAVAKTIGYDIVARKVLGEKALLAYAAQPLIREAVCVMLESELDYSKAEAEHIMTEVWRECEDEEVFGISGCTRTLFSTLKQRGIRIAVCTSDVRSSTMANLEALGVLPLVDVVVCGDDEFGRPKPNPHNAFYICDQLSCLPEEVAVVGDTNADMLMGRNAGLGLVVGVLSGVGNKEDLAPNAHVILSDVDRVAEVLGFGDNN